MIFISILILIVAKALPSINKSINSAHFTRISAIVFLYSGVLSFNTFYVQTIGTGVGIYSGLLHITQISQLLESFLLLIGALILVAWPLNLATNTGIEESLSLENSNYNIVSAERGSGVKTGINYSTDYSLIVLFSTLGSCLLISCSDLVSLYLSIELQSFGVYILSTLYRDSESSTSAGLKYFLLGGLSSCLILLGAGLIYAYSGLTNFESIYTLISVSHSSAGMDSNLVDLLTDNNYIIQGILLGLIIIFVGLLFKIAAAPLHNWAPDVYDETPTIVTIWLTIMPKIAILMLLLELQSKLGLLGSLNTLVVSSTGYADYLNSFSSISLLHSLSTMGIEASLFKLLLLISSLLSLIVGTVVGLAQTRIKRLLTYSTISHIGFMLLALAINTEQSIDSLLFYIIQYSLTNLNMFLIILALSYVFKNLTTDYKDIRYISEFKSKFFENPILSLSLAISLFSMAGIPPLMGFFSKQFVLYSAVQSGYYFIALIAILVSVVSASYYLKIIKVLHTEEESLEESHQEIEAPEARETILTNFHSFLISTLTLSILLFILKPSLILNSTQLLSLSLFNA